jgi:hypothetical protein
MHPPFRRPASTASLRSGEESGSAISLSAHRQRPGHNGGRLELAMGQLRRRLSCRRIVYVDSLTTISRDG